MRILILSLLITMSASTFANLWFPMTMQAYISSNHVQGTVFNNTQYSLLKCKGRVFGRTQYGQIGSANFCVNVGRGSYANAYLHAHGYNYFTQAWASVQCRPIRSSQYNQPCF